MILGDVIQKPSELCSGLDVETTFITYPVKLLVENLIPLDIESPYLITITSEVRSLERTGKRSWHKRIYDPITAMGFSAMFTFQLDNTKR